jgi:hypothetical protein
MLLYNRPTAQRFSSRENQSGRGSSRWAWQLSLREFSQIAIRETTARRKAGGVRLPQRDARELVRCAVDCLTSPDVEARSHEPLRTLRIYPATHRGGDRGDFGRRPGATTTRISGPIHGVGATPPATESPPALRASTSRSRRVWPATGRLLRHHSSMDFVPIRLVVLPCIRPVVDQTPLASGSRIDSDCASAWCNGVRKHTGGAHRTRRIPCQTAG